MSVRRSTTTPENEGGQKEQERVSAGRGKSFGRMVLFFLVILLAVYFYFILADLSTAPKYVYSQF